VSIDSDSTIPVQSNKGPSQWTRDGWNMNEAWVSWVAEIQGRKIEEVENQDELSQVETRPNKEHDEPKLEQIVENEMASNGSSSIDKFSVGGEQVPNVSDLEEEEQNPVDGNDDHVHCKSGMEMSVLVPDTSSWQHIIIRLVNAVIHAGHDDQQPGQGCEELVDPDSCRTITVPLDKRIDLVKSLHGVNVWLETSSKGFLKCFEAERSR